MDQAEVLPPATLPAASRSLVVQAHSDATLLQLWLHGRPAGTQSAYRRDAGAFLERLGARTLPTATIGDVQGFADGLTHLKPASQARKLAAIKSLFAFAHRLGYLQFDVARPLRLPRVKDDLAARIVSEAELARMLSAEPSPRNHAMLRLLYGAGLRVSELCGLRWRDLSAAKPGGQATVFGKGGKTRAVLIQPKLWKILGALRGTAGVDDPVFRSAKGGALVRSQVHRVVKAAAARAGLPAALSAHWLRHAHASHALDHGAPVHVLQASLGHASLATTTRYTHARPGDGSARYLPE